MYNKIEYEYIPYKEWKEHKEKEANDPVKEIILDRDFPPMEFLDQVFALHDNFECPLSVYELKSLIGRKTSNDDKKKGWLSRDGFEISNVLVENFIGERLIEHHIKVPEPIEFDEEQYKIVLRNYPD